MEYTCFFPIETMLYPSLQACHHMVNLCISIIIDFIKGQTGHGERPFSTILLMGSVLTRMLSW